MGFAQTIIRNLCRVNLAGYGNTGHRHEQTDQHGTGITHKQSGFMPVEGQEPSTHSNQDGGNQRGQIEIVCRANFYSQQVAIDQENAVRNQSNSGHKTIEAVNEINCIHHQDNDQNGNQKGEGGRSNCDTLDRQRQNLHTLPGHNRGNRKLCSKFDGPVQIPQIIENAHKNNQECRCEDRQNRAWV